MDFIDQIKQISDQIGKLRSQILTEEATKNAFVLPLIQALGYNVFNPIEVCPEFTADAPGLKGEKVDYAIFNEDKLAMLFECKWCGHELGHPKHGSQLYRYLSSTDAKFGVLTNGVVYRFYTDLDKLNTMDTKPFFEFNMLDIQDNAVAELKRFSKDAFNPDELKTAAKELMYTKEIKRIMSEQLASPTPDFVRFFIPQVYSGKATQSVVENFTEITKRSLNQLISERVTDRLSNALKLEEPTPLDTSSALSGDSAPTEAEKNKIVTTEEELESFFIVKAILRESIEPARVQYRDTQSYFAICLDGKPSRTICRLWFNSKQKYIGFLDDTNQEVRQPISNLNDLYGFSTQLKTSVDRFLPKAA
jgi:predicted type IV restriction endonuclease